MAFGASTAYFLKFTENKNLAQNNQWFIFKKTSEWNSKKGGGFKYFLFPPLPGEGSHFD